MKETRLRNQVRRLQRRLELLNRSSYRYSGIRLAIFVSGTLISGVAFYVTGIWLGLISLVAMGLFFGIAVYTHRQIDKSIIRHQAWLQIKSAQIARIRLDWKHIPTTFGYRPGYNHPFEADLDLVGERSLYRLVDTAVSYEGSQRLRAWLTTPVPELGQIVQRQRLVRELTPLHLFRDKLILNATVAAGTKKTWSANQLTAWLQRHAPEASLRPWLLLSTALTALNLVLFVANRLGLVPPVWQITFLLHLGLVLVKSRAIGATFDQALALADALRQLGAVFRQLETFSYRDAPHLKALCAPFLDARHRPSKYLTRVARVIAALSVRGNPAVWFILNALTPWDFLFAQRLNRHKVDLARYAPAWMDVWFELEALSSLANLAYLNPSYAFPSFLAHENQKPPFVFHAHGLGHPLIPDEEKVCNAFTITGLGEVMIITGSNMAGKTVFLKTVGANLALAYAGGPVNARSLQTALFRQYTCIKVSDSLTNGISYFYAEVKRLTALLSELERDHSLPLFFYIDEIFRGTNNRERFIGSRAYIRALVAKHGAGLIATHDLELTKLADQIPQIKNHHFRDAFLDGRMVFDYTLRPGPCPTTNALKIMRMEGLPVPTDPSQGLGSD